MSLQVWLPLNGDLHNQGLYELPTPSQSSVSYNENGKIGSCMTGTTAWKLSEEILDNQWSVALWMKPTSTFGSNNNIMFCKNTSASNDCQIYFSIINGTSLHLGVNGATSTVSKSFTFNTNTWYHLVGTYDGLTAKLYINGVLQNSATTAAAQPTGKLNIRINGRSTNAANTTQTGYLSGYNFNDFRLYNHALSDKEIKEIAKGLVLHYKLDDGYSEITTNLCNGLKNGGRTTLNNNVITTTGENADTYWYVKTSTPLISETTYTLSLECSGLSSNEAFWRFGVGAQNGENCCGNFTIKNGYNTFTFVLPTGLNGVTQFILDDTNRPNWEDVTSFYNVQLEQKDHATGYAGIGGVRNIGYVYDSSGYQNNGTIVGTLSVNNNTSHYSKSILFNGTDACIRVPYKECNPDGIFTLNLWFYKDALGSKNYETLFGGPSGFEMDTRSGASTTLSLYMASTRGGNAFSPFSLSTWYMVTMVRDGTNEMYYINGELKKTIEAKSMPNGIYRIGAWASDTGQNYYGNISDFRIYATALSDEDILDLYHTPFSIDNKGNGYAREIIEDANLNITKTGQFHSNEMLDNNDYTTASITKDDKQLKVNTLYEY